MLLLVPALLAAGLFFIMAVNYYSKTQALRLRNNYLEQEFQNLNIRLDNSNSRIIELEKDNASANEKISYLQKQLKEQETNREEIVKNARSVMYDLGNKISGQLLEQQKQESRASLKMSEENISKTTNNLNEEIKKLVNKVSAIDKEVYNSKNTIDVVKNSLLSPKGAGELAEMTLENLLKASNLQEDIDYVLQYKLNYKTHNNYNYRPDALVFLPDNNVMIIDAKASTALMDAEQVDSNSSEREGSAAAENESGARKSQKDKKLYESISRHLNGLAAKDYKTHASEYFKQNGMEVNNIFTLMFLPTEQAIEKVTSIDSKFLFKAWEKEIFPVGPSGMVNMLNFAKFQITEHRRNDNYKVIIEEVKRLLGACSTLYEHANKLGNNIYNLTNNYDKFAASFNSNFLSKAKNLEKLGVYSSSNKSLDNNLSRYQIVTSKLEMIAAEDQNDFEETQTAGSKESNNTDKPQKDRGDNPKEPYSRAKVYRVKNRKQQSA